GIIPHTWEATVFSSKKIGDKVNLEFDVLGKYIEQIAVPPKD
ncbi:MAG: riboflavin synthase, partial [Bacteroidota bacterium]|nr:riboflavin synthase [Bacteroidota bacterium]